MQSFNLAKLVLTVFTSNSSALKFYERLGFVDDDTSPGEGSYKILSKINANIRWIFYRLKIWICRFHITMVFNYCKRTKSWIHDYYIHKLYSLLWDFQLWVFNAMPFILYEITFCFVPDQKYGVTHCARCSSIDGWLLLTLLQLFPLICRGLGNTVCCLVVWVCPVVGCRFLWVLLVLPATAPTEPQHVREVDHDDATEEDDVHYHLKNKKIVDKGASQG